MSGPTGLPNGYYWAKAEVGPSFPVLLSDGVWFQATWEEMPEGELASFEIGDKIEEPE